MTVFRLLTATLILGVTLSAAHAAEGNAAIASGAKLTKADAARTAPGGAGTGDAAGAIAPDAAARGIEKKDIRRGMVIAKPSSLNSRDTHQAPGECPPCGTLPRTPKPAPHD